MRSVIAADRTPLLRLPASGADRGSAISPGFASFSRALSIAASASAGVPASARISLDRRQPRRHPAIGMLAGLLIGGAQVVKGRAVAVVGCGHRGVVQRLVPVGQDGLGPARPSARGRRCRRPGSAAPGSAAWPLVAAFPLGDHVGVHAHMLVPAQPRHPRDPVSHVLLSPAALFA